MTEPIPERSGAASRAWPAIAIAAIAAAALALRVWHLDAGVPFAVGTDEPVLVENALRIVKTGAFHPHIFDYPSLLMYLLAAVDVVWLLLSALSGSPRLLATVSSADVYVWNRALSAVLGAATVGLACAVAARWSRSHAIVAGAILAVAPLHVRESHYALTDVPLTFFATAALLLSLRAHERVRVAAFAAAGAAVGLAAATKYNGAIALVMPWAAAALAQVPLVRRLQLALVASAAALAAFLVGAPYTVLDLPGFLDGFATLNAAYSKPNALGDPVWLVYLKHLRLSFGWPGLLLAGGGLALAAARSAAGPDRARWLLPLLFTAAYFYVLSGRSLVFGRYLLPIVPCLAIVAAAAVMGLAARLPGPRLRGAAAFGLALVAVAPAAAGAVRFNQQIGRPTTKALTYEWLRANVPPGTRLALEDTVLVLPHDQYRAESLPALPSRPLEYYRERGVAYFVTSSTAGLREAAYHELFGESAPVFVAVPDGRRQGPMIRIYPMPPAESERQEDAPGSAGSP